MRSMGDSSKMHSSRVPKGLQYRPAIACAIAGVLLLACSKQIGRKDPTAESGEMTEAEALGLAESLLRAIGFYERPDHLDGMLKKMECKFLPVEPTEDPAETGGFIRCFREPATPGTNGMSVTIERRTRRLRMLGAVPGYANGYPPVGTPLIQPRLTPAAAAERAWGFVAKLRPDLRRQDFRLHHCDATAARDGAHWNVLWCQVLHGIPVWEGNAQIVFFEDLGLTWFHGGSADIEPMEFTPKLSKQDIENRIAPDHASRLCNAPRLRDGFLYAFRFARVLSVEPLFSQAYNVWQPDNDFLDNKDDKIVSTRFRAAWYVKYLLQQDGRKADNCDAVLNSRIDVSIIFDGDTGEAIGGSGMTGGY